jgi:hypothetical protein
MRVEERKKDKEEKKSRCCRDTGRIMLKQAKQCLSYPGKRAKVVSSFRGRKEQMDEEENNVRPPASHSKPAQPLFNAGKIIKGVS